MKQTPKSKRPRKHVPLSINALSERHGIDRRTLKKYLADVKPVRHDGKSALYDEAEALAAIEAHAKKVAEGGSLKDQKTYEEVRKLRLANDIKDKSLVLRSAVIRCIMTILARADAILEEELCIKGAVDMANRDTPNCRLVCKQVADRVRAKLQTLHTELQTVDR